MLKDFYNADNEKSSHIKLYAYNNGHNIIINLDQMEVSATQYQTDYNNVIKEYLVDLAHMNQTIIHNHKLINDNNVIKVKFNEERVGIIVFKNSRIKDFKCTDNGQDLILQDYSSSRMLIIKNWYKDDTYKISMFDFDHGLEFDRIYVSDETIERLGLNNVFDRELSKDIVKARAVIHYLISACKQYTDALANSNFHNSFLEDELRILDSRNNHYSQEDRINLLSTNNQSGRAFMLLLGKSYNELLLQYPDVQTQDVQAIYSNCFNTILSQSKREEMLKCVKNRNFSEIDQFINDNKQDVEQIVTILMSANNDEPHKHRHHHGENGERGDRYNPSHHRGRRDIDHHNNEIMFEDDDVLARDEIYAMAISSAITNQPFIHNTIHWIIRPFKYLFINDRRDDKKESDVDYVKQRIDSISNNLLNQDMLSELNDVTGHADQVLKVGFLGNSHKANATFNHYGLTHCSFNINSTLALGELFIRKCTNVQRDTVKLTFNSGLPSFLDGLSEHDINKALERMYSAQKPHVSNIDIDISDCMYMLFGEINENLYAD